MEAPQQEAKNPLGLSLDFMFGRGYLWAERQRLSDWIALESLRMEIPDLKFPFDARGGLQRFRHTRCLVRQVEFAISEVGLGDLLAEAASRLEGFEELEVRFVEDAVHVSLKLSRFGSEARLSFRAAVIPPEPARADEVHLSLYDYRAYGPLPYPARLVVHELVTSLLNTPVLRSSGRGDSFMVGVAGDIIRFRPLKLLFLYIFPKVGWKLPDLSGVVLQGAKIRPGVMTIRAVDDDPKAGATQESERSAEFELATSTEGARALAAYEAKELFSHADKALFDGQIRQALSLLSNYRDVYGLHPHLVARLLDCLVADASAANLAEAESIRRALVDEDPTDLQAALVAPLVALARRRSDEAVEAFEALADALEERQQTRDWILCQLALARQLADDAPKQAATRLRQVLKRDPRHRGALEMLRTLYERIDESARLEETLKRLTGVYTDRETLKETYLELARHLMDRQGDLGEARMYLEKVLRLEPTQLEALHALGESYVLGGEPLRALKAFGSAARTAENEQRQALASRLQFRVGELWYEQLEDPRQALLGFRRALSLSSGDEHREPTDEGEGEDRPVGPVERARQLRRAAQMCEELSRDEEATRYWTEVVPLLEQREERSDEFDEPGDGETRSRQQELVEAHRSLGEIYERRRRPSAAATHYRRVLEIRPDHSEAVARLEDHLSRSGRPEELLALYEDLLERSEDDTRRFELLEKLGDLHANLDLPEDGQSYYRRALDIAPDSGRVRRKLVELLTEHRRFETLCDALNSVLVRTRDRQTQREITLELAGARESAGDLERAARAYLEAVKLQAGDREALEGAARVLEAYVEQHGASAKAPVGNRPAGRLLEKTLIRFAEVVPSASRERELLLKVAMLADERGDTAAASEARDRARALDDGRDDAGGDEFRDVDARLDAMLDELDDVAESTSPSESKTGTESLPKQPDPSPPPETRRAVETPTASQRSVDSPAAPEEDGAERDEELASFRRRFASMIKQPSKMPPEEALESSTEDSDSTQSPPFDENDSGTSSRQAASNEEIEERPKTAEMSLEQFSALAGDDADPSDVDDERERGDGDSSFHLPTPSLEDDASDVESRASFGDDDPSKVEPSSPSLGDDPSEVDTSPQIHPVDMAKDALEEVRDTGDVRDVAEAIENVLTLAESTDSEVLDERDKKTLSKEAGELLYYELEDDEAARPFLETVRRLDPEGTGSEPAVVNALEAIYEQRGDVDARIELLEQRLEAADSPEMKTTYRLLLAQLIWEERDDARRARRWLDEVLSSDEHHEAAHRLLAQIARREKDWEAVARHLSVVARTAGGGIDAVEAERDLAQVYLHRLDRPEEAIEHYERVLEEAPGDSNALEGFKEAQAATGDWDGYLDSLGRELGLLFGSPDEYSAKSFEQIDPSEVASALRVPASQIVADAAHVVEERLGDDARAHTLWGVAYELWPEHVEALQRRIELDRSLERKRELAEDLETYAAMVLDPVDRFEALSEAARIWAERLDEPNKAGPLYAEAVALVGDADQAPDGVDAARRALERLRQNEEWR